MQRWYKTLKGECIRVKPPLSLEDARRIVAEFVAHYNDVRWHSAIGDIAPADTTRGPVASGCSSPSGIASWMRRTHAGGRRARRVGRRSDPRRVVA
jgi:Integrase core domain